MMMQPPPAGPRPRWLSLRWQAILVLSLVLAIVNGTLALVAYQHSQNQFELQQSGVRENQIRQMRGLLAHNDEELTRLIAMVPLLGARSGSGDLADFGAQLRRGLETDGALLGLEWDIRAVYWLGADGRLDLVWPAGAPPPGAELLAAFAGAAEGTVRRMLACAPECLQFVAAPVLWQGATAGTLVLGRSVADALLTFNELTGADVAVLVDGQSAPGVDAGAGRFPAITHDARTGPIVRDLLPRLVRSNPPSPGVGAPVLEFRGGRWFEVFLFGQLVPGVSALVVDDVTAEREAVHAAAWVSALIGFIGLALSWPLMYWFVQSSVGRLRRIAAALPLLAENRYAELLERLPPAGHLWAPQDELDDLTATARALTTRMDGLQRDREEAQRRLVWLADHDPLTRLANRRRFEDEFSRVLDRAKRYGHQGVLMLLDLDQFKDVNDLSGHQIGDLMLQRVAERLRGLVRQSDILARLGGDEFALVLPECTVQGAIALAERVQAVVRAVVVQDRDRMHRVTASIGLVQFPTPGDQPDALLVNADLAMFQAKDRGRGQWQLFSADDQTREQTLARVTWRDKIAEALREDRFELHYQPIVQVATGSIAYWEALLRLREPDGELAMPGRFIPIAEKTGLIRAIDHWVLHRALQSLGQEPSLRLSVNLSASAMDDVTLLPALKRLLADYRVDPERLTFELTETVAVANTAQAAELMQEIGHLGCRFALDDFGSGYASYAYVRQFPVHSVKIDGAFIRDLATNREDRIFVKAITDVAHGMGKQVTAEFVETAAIYSLLGELGVDFAQGYYLGRPAPVPAPGPWPRPDSAAVRAAVARELGGD